MRWLPPGLILAGTVAFLALTAAPARAEREPLDGVWIMVGPVGAGAHVEDEWVSAVGLELSVVRVAERSLPAAVGLTAGGVSYGGRAGGRFWLEGEMATGSPLPVGLGAGLALEVDRVRPARPGAQVTLWLFTGIVPYVRAGTVLTTGGFLEAGVMLKIPARRFP